MGLGLGLDAALYTKEIRCEPLDRRSMAANRWAIWADMGFSVYCFSFSFSFLLHHCEVTLKNNYVICTNIFLYITVWIQVFI
jgi:hypothetical protein